MSLSSDGSVVAIGAPFNGGNGRRSGHVRIYEWDGSSWLQRGQDIDGEEAGGVSGASISLSADGNVVAIGAPNSNNGGRDDYCLLYTSPSPRDLSTSRMPSSA